MDERGVPWRALVAKPGDDDLTLDIDGVTITAVIVGDGHELLVETTGGFGRFLTPDGGWIEADPGEGALEETELRLRLGLLSEDSFEHYVTRLEQWRDEAVPLRLCLAPGRVGTILADEEEWLPFPSGPWPELLA